MSTRKLHEPLRPAQPGRILLAIMSLPIFLLGSGTLFRGGLHYGNWWGGLVFAPFAILIGIGGFLIAAFKPIAIQGSPKKRSRIRGWPTGKARYYPNRG